MKQIEQRRIQKIRWITRTAALIAITAVTCVASAQQIITPSPQLSARLHQFLQKYLGPPDKTTQVNIAWVKTASPSGREAIVYVSGRNWCGSGGCNMLVLESHETAFKIIGNTSVVQLPISVLPKLTHQHPDLGVFVAGGGIMKGYQAILAFNGKKYPGNPTVPPARKWNGSPMGEVVISDQTKAQPLYK